MLRRVRLKFRRASPRGREIMSPTIEGRLRSPPSFLRLRAYSTPKIIRKILVERQSIRTLDRFLLP